MASNYIHYVPREQIWVPKDLLAIIPEPKTGTLKGKISGPQSEGTDVALAI